MSNIFSAIRAGIERATQPQKPPEPIKPPAPPQPKPQPKPQPQPQAQPKPQAQAPAPAQVPAKPATAPAGLTPLLQNVTNRQQGPVLGPVAPGAPTAPVAPVDTVTPERQAKIDSWVKDNATHEKGGIFWDSEGGTRASQALRGDSDLGRLTDAERAALAEGSVKAWQGQSDNGRFNENVREAVDGVRNDPAAREALAAALARPEMSNQAIYAKGGSVASSPEWAQRSVGMLETAMNLDPAAVVRANPGLEPQIAKQTQWMDGSVRDKLWSAAADRNSFSPEQQQSIATSLFMFEDKNGARNGPQRTDIANALANARAPGSTDADRIAREQMARNLDGVMAHEGAREMLFGEKVTPEMRVWALDQVAGRGTSINADAFKDGWESEAISKAYAAKVTDAYQTRGTDPQSLGGEALRNTVGQAMGIRPDMLPQGEPSAEFLERGMNNQFYSNGGNNQAIDDVQRKITELGGPQARVSVVPVTITSKDEGAATVPVFRVDDKTTGEARFVDHTGRTYTDLKDWEENNKLPEGKMTYAKGMDLKSEELSHGNTPGVVDSFGEGFGKVMDGVALGAGIVAAGALVIGTGGTTAPLVIGGGAALWTTGRAASDLHDKATHGQDITDLSDPSVRSNWLEVAAGALSVGAVGGALKLGAMGGRATPAFARAVSGTATAAEVMDGAAVTDQSIQLARNWDNMSGQDRAAGLLNVAFWGGMAGASARSGGIARNGSDGMSFAGLDQRIRAGATTPPANVPVSQVPGMGPGEVRVAYDTRNGRATNIRIEHGAGTPDPAQLALHEHTAAQLSSAGGLRSKLDNILRGKAEPEPGSSAFEAKLEIDKITREADALARTQTAGLTQTQRNDIAVRQRELDQALVRETNRLNSPIAQGNGFVAAPRSLTDLLSLHEASGAITRGVPANLAPLSAPAAAAPSRIDYGSLNASGQAQGIEATITRDMLGTGSHAKGSIKPPGWDSDNGNHSRGHLLARMLGGSGSDERNLVTLFQRDTNSPVMRDFETQVHDAVAAGETVNYRVTPIYDGDGKPTSVALQARGSQGLDISITIVNRDGR